MTRAPQPEPRLATAEWARLPERSTPSLLRLMTWISLRLGRRLTRALLYVVVPYFLLFAPTARRASRDYLRRVLGRAPRLSERFRHLLTFATAVHDRVYLVHGRFDLFDIRLHGREVVEGLLASGDGVFLMGAHMGSFEVVRALGRRKTGLSVTMVMYEENARKINEVLAAVNPAAAQDVIPLGRVDSMLQVRDRIEAGGLVGILGDRSLGQEGIARLDFLGSDAGWPTGPWRMAAMLKRPVILMLALYRGGNRYDIHFEPLADFSRVGPGTRESAQREAMARYVARLEQFAREAPFNWFNFFDFWRADPQREGGRRPVER